MSAIALFFKKHTLWLGFLAVLVPLMVLLGLEFTSLTKLRRVSAIAHKAALNNYLEAIGTEVQYFYRSSAERALNVPAALFTQGRLDEVAYHWKKKPVEGVSRLFLADYTRTTYGNFLVFNPSLESLETPPASDESLAIIVACTPWQLLSSRQVAAETPALAVYERNPDYRLILNPITDDASRVVGVAGMILDQEHFRKTLLPSAIRKALPGFFPDVAREDLVVTVRDSSGKLVLATRELGEKGEVVSARFPFVFTNWTLSLHSPRSTPEQLARASFAFNVAVTVLVAVVLVSGIAFALRSADRAMKLSAMKSDFVSNVSHELRTPLASIRVFAELLRLGKVPTPARVQEYGEYIEAETRRLTRLINNILDFARIESGRKTYVFARADLREVVETTLKTFEVRLRPDGFHIGFEGPPFPLPPVEIDPDAIGQAFHNLLDNAVKYSGGSKEILVRLARDNDSLVISVRDHGIGIAPDEQKKIFERFHRVSTGLVHDVRGSGLGLSIVHHIAQAHRGRVTVQSEPGSGSTFSIHLPLSPRPEGSWSGGPDLFTREDPCQKP